MRSPREREGVAAEVDVLGGVRLLDAVLEGVDELGGVVDELDELEGVGRDGPRVLIGYVASRGLIAPR